MNEQLKELQRRIIEDIKESEKEIAKYNLSYSESAELRGRIDGLKIALYEISIADKPEE